VRVPPGGTSRDYAVPVPWSFARDAGKTIVNEPGARSRPRLQDWHLACVSRRPTVPEVAQIVVINRGTCAAGRTGDKVKQVERTAWSALSTCLTT
jgi:hypothetical protein